MEEAQTGLGPTPLSWQWQIHHPQFRTRKSLQEVQVQPGLVRLLPNAEISPADDPPLLGLGLVLPGTPIAIGLSRFWRPSITGA
jgi:hypothetical protein